MVYFLKYLLLSFVLLFSIIVNGQIWKKQVAQKTSGSVLATYSWGSHNDYHSAYGEITLIKNGRFKYFCSRPLRPDEYCEGTYTMTYHKLILNSDLQNDNVEVNIEYVDTTQSDSLRNRLDFPLNSKGEVLYSGYYFLNKDTTTNGWFDPAYPLNRHRLDSITSIRVLFNEADFGTPWIPIQRSSKFIRVRILTDKNFTTYKPIVFKDLTFEIQNGTLTESSSKK